MAEDKRDAWSKLEIVAKTFGAIVISIVIVAVGHLLTTQRERTDRARLEAERIARLSTQLSSESPNERRLALELLKYDRRVGKLPKELVPVLQSVIISDELPLAVDAAILALDLGNKHASLFKLFAPMAVHLKRTEQAFRQWNSCRETEMIYQSNSAIRELLLVENELIPADLRGDASELIRHYNAWLAEYGRHKREHRNVCKPVYVGPLGFPFPMESASRFLKQFEVSRAKYWSDTPESTQ